jgi:nucleoside-diphosphate-sugar epimerase
VTGGGAAPSRVLLIGGTGFLGAHASRVLGAAGHDVWTLARGERPAPDPARTLRADRHDPEQLARALEGRRFDFTVDFGAYDASDVERLLLVPYAALGRYVLISSGQVYLVTEAAHVPYREEDSAASLRPEPAPGTRDHAQWRYGVGKRRAEGAVLALRASHGMRAIVLRLPIVHGEGDGTLRLWAYLERLRDGAPVALPDGGDDLTRYLYAGDLARALVRLLQSAPPPEAVYNLSGADTLPLRAFLERAATLAGVSPKFVSISRDEAAAAGFDAAFSPLSGPWSSRPDPGRAMGDWGFTPSRLDEWLPGVVRWHLEHAAGRSHPGYATRAAEKAWIEKHSVAR